MRHRSIALVLVLAGLAPLGSAHAQRPASDSTRENARSAAIAQLPVGALLRVRTAEPGLRYHVGTLLAADRGGLLLHEQRDTVRVPAAHVRVVERQVGRRAPDEAFMRGARRGLLVGFAVGTVATSVTAIIESRDGCGDCFISTTAIVGAASVALTGVTTLAGAASGLAHRDIWVREALPRR